METEIIFFRLIMIFVLALLFGLERQKSHKPIGFGTFVFVSLGSCGLAIVAIILGGQNPLPLLGAIVTGIGFLGAGALLKTTDKIYGFTTAASIWVFSIIGLVIGVGEYFVSLIIYFLVWAIIIIDKRFEKKGVGGYQKKVSIKIKNSRFEKNIEDLFKGFNKLKMISIESDKKGQFKIFNYMVDCNGKDLRNLTKILDKNKLIFSYKIE